MGLLYLFTTSPKATLALREQALGASASALHEVLALGLHLLDILMSARGCGGWRSASSAGSAGLSLAADLEDGRAVFVAGASDGASDRASQAGKGVAQTSCLNDSRALILLVSGVGVLWVSS